MNKKCIIHIGMPKAGSSAIQNFMFAQREYFLTYCDVNYYEAGANHSGLWGAFCPKNNRALLNRLLFTDEDISRFRKETLSRFETAIQNNKSQTFVLSGEALGRFDEAAVRYLRDITSKYFEQTQIVYYARDPYTYARSCCQQWFKGGHSFHDIVKNTIANQYSPAPPPDPNLVFWNSLRPNYSLQLEKFIKTFGRKSVLIRDFTRENLVQHDVIEDFLQSALNLVLDRNALPDIKYDDNQSIDHAAAWTLNQINAIHPPFICIDDKCFPNPRRARSLAAFIKVNSMPQEKFRLINFDWKAYKEVIMPDAVWLKKITDGNIDFTKLPLPEMEIDCTFDGNRTLADLINELALNSERQAEQIRLMKILKQAQSELPINHAKIDLFIRNAVSPDPLFKLARGLKNLNQIEPARHAARYGLYLCGLDSKLKEDFENLLIALKKMRTKGFNREPLSLRSRFELKKIFCFSNISWRKRRN